MEVIGKKIIKNCLDKMESQMCSSYGDSVVIVWIVADIKQEVITTDAMCVSSSIWASFSRWTCCLTIDCCNFNNWDQSFTWVDKPTVRDVNKNA